MKTVLEVLTFAERVRKASVTFYSLAAPYVAALATQDLSTPAGVIGAVVVLFGTAATYGIRNKPVPA